MKTALETAMQFLISNSWAESQHGDLNEDTRHYSLVPIDGANRDPIGSPHTDPDEQAAIDALEDGHYLVIETDLGHVYVGGPLTAFQVVQWRRAHDEGTLDDLLEDGALIRAIPAIY